MPPVWTLIIMRVSASNPRTTLRIAFPDWTLTIVACTATHSQRRPSHMSLSAIVFAVGARFVLSRRSWWRGVGGAHLMTVARIRCCWLLYRPAQTKNIPRIPPIDSVSIFDWYTFSQANIRYKNRVGPAQLDNRDWAGLKGHWD